MTVWEKKPGTFTDHVFAIQDPERRAKMLEVPKITVTFHYSDHDL
jgi:hypothetical protein